MISNGFTFIAVLLAIAALIQAAEHYGQWRIFRLLPAVVLLYFVVMLCSTLGLWQQTPEINSTFRVVRNNLLPAMIFLMLLKSDLRSIVQLGPKMLGAFAVAVISIICGFVVSFLLMHSVLDDDAWKTFAALAGSWMGGTANMAAVQAALAIPDSRMGYTLLMDSIDYALWVMLLLALVPHAGRFNRWVGADGRQLQQLGKQLEQQQQQQSPVHHTGLLVLLALSLVASSSSQAVAQWLPQSAFFSATTWSILLVTVAGVLAAMTRLGRLGGSVELSQLMLYLIIALIASRADFADMAKAPLYVLAGLIVLFVHGAVMVMLARLFKLDLFTCGVASLANIGGVASAPILAAAYSRALIPVGVLMAMLGYIVGTAGGLLVGKLLSLLS